MVGWKKSLAGMALSLAIVGGTASMAGAQEPVSLTAYVSLCSADLTQCENVQSMDVYYHINGGPDQVVQTNADGEASFEVTTGDEVSIAVDPEGIEGASISPESQAGYTVDSVTGDEETFNFIFIEDAPATTVTPAATTTTTTPEAALPTTGVGPLDGSGSNSALLLAVAGSAVAAGAAGVALRKRSVN